MAISIKPKNPEQVLQAFGISSHKIQELHDASVAINMTTNAITLASPNGIVQTVPVKSGAVSMAIAGKLGPASKQSIGYKLAKAVQQSLGATEKEAKTEVYAEAYGAGNKVKKSKSPPYIPDNMPKGAPVQLKDANSLYQPVKGTSDSSIYNVIGITDELKIAARYKGTSLSFRVEGDVNSYKKQLENAGFSLGNIGKGYVSVHMEVPDDLLASRTIGAILVGLGLQMDTPLPTLYGIKGQGA